MFVIMWREPDLNAGSQYDCYVPEVFEEDGYVRDIHLAKRFVTQEDAQTYLTSNHYALPVRDEYGWVIRQEEKAG